MSQSGDASRPSVSGRAAVRIGGAVALVVLALVVYGGYGEHWRWVGVNGATATLWDWLHLLLLPIAAVVLTAVAAPPPADERRGGHSAWRRS